MSHTDKDKYEWKHHCAQRSLSNYYLPKKLDIILDIKLIKTKDKTTTDNKKSPH